MLNKVVDYKIISSQESDSLETHVKNALQEGWTPSGPVFDFHDNLNQAMVKFGQ